jgi:hypothetical protein
MLLNPFFFPTALRQHEYLHFIVVAQRRQALRAVNIGLGLESVPEIRLVGNDDRDGLLRIWVACTHMFATKLHAF